MDKWLQGWLQQEYAARRGAAIFLTLYALIGLDVMSIKDAKQRQQATVAWTSWGIVFILVAFFIIAPEQETA